MKRVILTIIIISLLTGSIVGCAKKRRRRKKKRGQGASRLFVKVKGRQLLADFDKDNLFEPYFIKGVNYNPMPVGRHPNDRGWEAPEEERPDNIFDDEQRLRRDFELLKKMGCNTIRLWKADSTFLKGRNRYPNRMTKKTLDLAEKYGLKVIAGFWINTKPSYCRRSRRIYKGLKFSKANTQKKTKRSFLRFINKFKRHPAILFWAIGNGKNEHFDSMDFDQLSTLYSLADELAAIAHTAEGKNFHPVAFVNGGIDMIGDITYEATDLDLKNLDIWGANVYRGETFGDLFEEYAEKSEKPLWIAEYGLDSWNSLDYRTPAAGGEDQETQAEWVGNLWDEIVANKEITIGATVKEYSDEWWRPDETLGNRKHHHTHDYYGIGPQDFNCDGYSDWYPEAPDNYFHEEWFGIMSVEEKILELDNVIPKKVYYTLKEKFGDK